MTPCGDMHQSFTGALVKWFFDNFPMFVDSFTVLSIHCVGTELGASLLYKCLLHRVVVPCDSTAFFVIMQLVQLLCFIVPIQPFAAKCR